MSYILVQHRNIILMQLLLRVRTFQSELHIPFPGTEPGLPLRKTLSMLSMLPGEREGREEERNSSHWSSKGHRKSTFHSIRPRYRQRSFPKLDGGPRAIQRAPLFDFAHRRNIIPVQKKDTGSSVTGAIWTFSLPSRKKSARKNLEDPREIVGLANSRIYGWQVKKRSFAVSSTFGGEERFFFWRAAGRKSAGSPDGRSPAVATYEITRDICREYFRDEAIYVTEGNLRGLVKMSRREIIISPRGIR